MHRSVDFLNCCQSSGVLTYQHYPTEQVFLLYVIGTAGHVDHGKSTLVHALTGTDPDRLEEEKIRGLSIDLGFAWLKLSTGSEVSIVDVPGHERFISNMLAGVGSINLAMLVVAGDESVMPQTREHLAILDLLDVRSGLVVVTKKDLVDPEWLDLVVADVEAIIDGTTLAGSGIFTVSGMTGEGVPELIVEIEDLLSDYGAEKDLERPRLSIDRVFTMAGFGTVVTGTLVDGSLGIGQEVELLPAGRKARIRGLQTHNCKLEQVGPATRVAVNLSGVSHGELRRGDVLTTVGWLSPTFAIDVRLRIIPDAPRAVRHNMFVTVHTGAAEALARLRLLDKDTVSPGESVWAQLKFEHPMVVVKGDHFVIRSSQRTLGGGIVVDADGRRHRRMHSPVLDRLSIMERGSAKEVILSAIKSSEPTGFDQLTRTANFSESEMKIVLEEMVSQHLVIVLGEKDLSGKYIYTSEGWSRLVQKSRDYVGEYHIASPLHVGVPKEQLRSFLGMTPQIFTMASARLQDEGILVDDGLFLRDPNYVRVLTDEQSEWAEGYIKYLESAPFSPPTDLMIDSDVIAFLENEGRLVKVSEGIVFSSEAYREIVDRITIHLREVGQITVADVRDMLGTSRKYALALMEYLDQEGVTRRIGDSRVLR